MSTNTLRPDLQPLPDRMKSLPIDARGYVVPWFVQWVQKEECICEESSKDDCTHCHGTGVKLIPCPVGQGEPEFRALDPKKRVEAILKKLCWVCGGKLGVNVVFVSGPMCGVSRTSAEPPSHFECAEWSAINCPFLSNPKRVRREDEIINNAQLRDSAPGIAITRNPGVTMLWVTRAFECFPDGDGGFLLQMGEPTRVLWYKEGLPATHTEVMTSVRSGLPNLYAIAEKQEGGMQALQGMITTFLAYIPPVNVHLATKI